MSTRDALKTRASSLNTYQRTGVRMEARNAKVSSCEKSRPPEGTDIKWQYCGPAVQTLFFPRAFADAKEVETLRLHVQTPDVSRSLDFLRSGETEWAVT